MPNFAMGWKVDYKSRKVRDHIVLAGGPRPEDWFRFREQNICSLMLNHSFGSTIWYDRHLL